MIKLLFVFMIGLLICQNAKAQKQDTLLYYMKNSGNITLSKDSADYFRFIMPEDSALKLYPVNDYYPNGKPRLKAASITRDYQRLVFDGAYITYFTNGKKKGIANYKYGTQIGVEIKYYPNGQLYYLDSIGKSSDKFLIECHDSTGKILTSKYNGSWIQYDDNVKNITAQGAVKNGLKEGPWTIKGDSGKIYTSVYKKGALMSTTIPNINDIFLIVDHEPQFKDGGSDGLNRFLKRNIKFPAVDRENGVSGRVVVTFVVEKNGSLTNIKVLRAPSPTMATAAFEVVKQSPLWIPGSQNNILVRVQFTISFAFNLKDG